MIVMSSKTATSAKPVKSFTGIGNPITPPIINLPSTAARPLTPDTITGGQADVSVAGIPAFLTNAEITHINIGRNPSVNYPISPESQPLVGAPIMVRAKKK